MEFWLLLAAMLVGVPLLSAYAGFFLEKLIPSQKACYTTGVLLLVVSMILFLVANPFFFPSPEPIMTLKRLLANEIFFAVSASFLLAGWFKSFNFSGIKS